MARKEVILTVMLLMLASAMFSISAVSTSASGYKNDKIDSKIYDVLENEDKTRAIIVVGDPQHSQIDKKSRAARIQQQALEDAADIIGKEKIKHKYEGINAFSASLTREDIDALSGNPDIHIYYDMPVKAYLDDSVAIMNISSSWNFNGYDLTGEGETACVIDTGVDYTHPDLGSCNPQRNTYSGNTENYALSSPHPYANLYTHNWTITMPGYTQIAVHFANISTEPRFDYVKVYNSNGGIIGIYTGDHTGLWSASALGDTIIVSLVTDQSVTDYGFHIDRVINGTVNTTYNWDSCSKVLGGYDIFNGDADPMDDQGHGTHVAGIIAADGTVKGVAPSANIVAVKALDDEGDGLMSDVAAGIEWCISRATEYNISVISMSLGGDEYSAYCDSEKPFMTSLINSAVEQNISVVVATGNYGNTAWISLPACIKNSTAVGATNKDDTIASYSKRNSLTDLMATGSQIDSLAIGGGYVSNSGTSMATPHVSGAMLLIRQYLREEGKSASAQDVEDILKSTGKNITDPIGGLTYRRINVLAALTQYDTPPSITGYSLSGTYTKNMTIRYDANITDSSRITRIIVESDHNGTLANYTYNVNSTSVTFSQNYTLNLNRGDILHMRLYAFDSYQNKNVTEWSNATIENSVPAINSIQVSSTDSLNRSSGNLSANVIYTDLDDDVVNISYSVWYKNLIAVPELENISIVYFSNLTKGDVWIYSIMLTDGYNQTGANSSAFTIQNSAPTFAGDNSVTINETGIINKTIVVSDWDNDQMNITLTNSSLDLLEGAEIIVSTDSVSIFYNSTVNDSGSYALYISADDGTDISNFTLSMTIIDAPDFDDDGIPDFSDDDDDNDSIVDIDDAILGNITNAAIYSYGSMTAALYINGSEDITQNITGKLPVTIAADNKTLVEFDWNFSSTLPVGTIYINKTTSAGYSAIKISGINLTAQGLTKTAYIEMTTGNRICVLDSENAEISSITSKCTGPQETQLTCDGITRNGYTCSIIDGIYKIEGLRHSVLKEYRYTQESSGGSSRGGGGGGGGYFVKTPSNITTNTTNQTNSTIQNASTSQILNNMTANMTGQDISNIEQPTDITGTIYPDKETVQQESLSAEGNAAEQLDNPEAQAGNSLVIIEDMDNDSLLTTLTITVLIAGMILFMFWGGAKLILKR